MSNPTPDEELERLAQRVYAQNKSRQRLSQDFKAHLQESDSLVKQLMQFVGKLLGMLHEKDKTIAELRKADDASRRNLE